MSQVVHEHLALAVLEDNIKSLQDFGKEVIQQIQQNVETAQPGTFYGCIVGGEGSRDEDVDFFIDIFYEGGNAVISLFTTDDEETRYILNVALTGDETKPLDALSVIKVVEYKENGEEMIRLKPVFGYDVAFVDDVIVKFLDKLDKAGGKYKISIAEDNLAENIQETIRFSGGN